MIAAIALIAGLAQQPAVVHCSLTRVNQAWQGTCTELEGEKQTLTIREVSALTTGRYRSDAVPAAMYAGESRMSAGAWPVELELYKDGTGILRVEGATWLPVAAAAIRTNTLAFDLNPGKTVPPSDLDRKIVERAAAILSNEAVWDRADDRKCDPADKTWSIYCAMTLATRQVTGGVHHRRPAMEVVRVIIEERTAGRSYSHRLMDYNNDPTTKLADVQGLFAEALKRMK